MDLKPFQKLRQIRQEVQSQFAQILAGQSIIIVEGYAPSSDPEPKYQVIGTIKDPLTRQLCQLNRVLADAVKSLSEPPIMGVPKSPEQLDAELDLRRETQKVKRLSSSIGDHLWIRIMDEFPETASVDASICKDWQVAIELDTCDCPVCTARRAMEAYNAGEISAEKLAEFLPPELAEQLTGLADAARA